MISTPICDFVREYAAQSPVRMHMPGHKGQRILGFEQLDITEIDGADDLFHPDGIIAASEANASRLFGCPTVYSVEGSSLCIRAMLQLAMTRSTTEKPWVLAGRNAHKAFLSAAILLDFHITWLCPGQSATYHACPVTAQDVASALDKAETLPFAVYLTSPDYLGNTVDIAAIARECRTRGVLLLVDNAHGAYLRFLPESRHPMDLGADLCCDSAHKTLPVLTGGAYLHIAPALADMLLPRVKDAMALFGSTSPSYLILQSLDMANPALETLPNRLSRFLPEVEALKTALTRQGYLLFGDEPLKLTISARPYGYTGQALAAQLKEKGILCEFCDPDFLVLMLAPENTADDLSRVRDALCAIPRLAALESLSCPPLRPMRAMSPRQAAFAPRKTLPIEQCAGRILACAAVSCPPAIPIVMCGEVIDSEAIRLFGYYGIEQCPVVDA